MWGRLNSTIRLKTGNNNTSILEDRKFENSCYSYSRTNEILLVKNIFLDRGRSEYGVNARSINIDSLPERKIPAQIRDEIPTLNQYGYMKFEWDEFCEEFVNYAANCNKPVLEIGTAYGWVVQRVLERDIRIIANDISNEHLEILLKKAPKEKLELLYIQLGDFLEDIILPQNSLGAVLSSRVLHFFDGENIEKGLDLIRGWLVDGGKLYGSGCSIYHYSINKEMLERIEQRKAKGEKWPAIIGTQKKEAPCHAPYVQDLFHPFDIEVLERVLPEHGFRIDKIKLFDYPSDTYSGGKGHVGFVATKV